MEEAKKVKVGIITLALSLIIIGTLWTLENLFLMAWIEKSIKFWPVILIIFGLELIITKKIYDNQDGVIVTLDAGVIILLILIVFVMGGISFLREFLPYLGIYL